MATFNVAQATSSRASAPKTLRALGPRAIEAEIHRLRDAGLYAMPIQMYWKKGEGKGKKAAHCPKWGHMNTPESWKYSIDKAMSDFRGANGVAILTGPSRLMVIDIDLTSDDTKEPGIDLWQRLVLEHGEPETLQAVSCSGGIHLYYKLDSPGLNWKTNFERLKVDGKVYGVDGRAEGGIIYAEPSSYIDGQGQLRTYRWLNGPPSFEACKEMPPWLVELVNRNHAGQSAVASGEKEETVDETLVELEGVLGSLPAPESVDQIIGGNERSTAVREIQDLLQKKSAGDANVRFGGTTVLSEGSRAFQFRVNGPRTCYLGREHNGSNNFTVIQGCAGDFRSVYYNCFGTACQGNNIKFLGELSISAAFEQASANEFGFRDWRASCETNLKARLPQEFLKSMVCKSDWGMASIFAKLFLHDRRIVYDAGTFWIWTENSWIACNNSESTPVKNAFMYHMGRVKNFWLKNVKSDSDNKIKEAERERDAELKALHDASGSLRSKGTKETAIRRAFETLKKDAVQLVKWPGPDIESVPIATRCLSPLKGLLEIKGFASELNASQDYLNTTSGAIHLPTGKLIPHHPSNMLSRSTDTEYVGPEYPSPLIDEFMLQIQTPEIIPILQMTLGYGVTGHSKEKQFVICYGPSNSGKTKLLSLIKAAIRLYYCTMDRDCVIGAGVRSEGAATPHLVRLEGAHIAGLEETKPEDVYNGNNVKSISSGGGGISARGLHKESVEIKCRCLPIICTNSLPKFDVKDSGMLKKLRVFPFKREFVENPRPNTNERLKDLQLDEKIETPEWRKQMLAWLVRGSMAWYARECLPQVEELPRDMQVALEGYVEANDHLSNFIADHCVKGEKWATHVDILKQAFENYVGRRDRPMSVTEFKTLMQSVHGVTFVKQVKIRRRNTTGYKGISLLRQSYATKDSNFKKQ